MKKYLSLLACGLLFTTVSFSQDRVLKSTEASSIIPHSIELQFNNSSEVPTFIVFDESSKLALNDFFTVTKKSLSKSNHTSWKLDSEKRDFLGYTHYRYHQYYKNIKVETGQYFVHLKNGYVQKANGVYYNRIDLSSIPTISENNALNIALAHCGASAYMWNIPTEENWLKQRKNDPSASFYPKGELVIMANQADFKRKDMRLCWKFDIYAHEPLSREYYYVDAHSGEIIYKENRICTGVANGTAVTMYSGTRSIITDSTGVNNYRLRDYSRPVGIETYDMNNGTSYGSAVDFTDTDNFWNTTTNDDHAANDAHWGAANTYDYFFLEHGRNSFDDAGTTIESYVHRGVNYNNAFWNGSVMTYGDGDGTTFTPLTALDVVGHEIAHGVTEFSSNLVYSYESGALNESFSDIFGTAIEFYALGEATGDYIIGEDMTPSGTGIRNMQDPNIKSDPDTYLGAFWHTSSSDNGGVHTNSGVQNFWYYLLVEGGTGTNDNGDPYNITGIGRAKADSVAYRNNNVYLTSSSQYADARSGAIQAALDLFGPCTPEVEAVTNAWFAVGVGAVYVPTVVADFESDITTACSAPFEFHFSNNSSNAGTFIWDFGDGNTSTIKNPSHTYNTFGSFSVELISDGGVCGVDTLIRTAYITIDSLIPCVAFVGDPTQTSCSGTIYDPGGPGSNYDDNLNVVTTISPNGAATVSLTFNSFDIEPGSGSTCNWDYVEIFDGPTVNSPSFGRFCNTTGNPGTINSTGPSLTVKFYSDVAVTHAGFDAAWNCVLNTAPPVANFSSDITQTCDGIVQFINQSAGVVDSVLWDFGDGNTSANFNPVHTYSSSGTYSVSLTAYNVNGSNTSTQVNYITVSRPSAPVVDDESNCGNGSVVFNGGANLNWYDQLIGGTLLGTGNTFVTPVLSSTTTYYAEELIPAPSENVGPVDNTFGGGAYFTGSQSLIFNCYKPSKLISVWVDAQTVGSRIIELRDNNGNILQDTTIIIPVPGGQRITLNFNIPVGNDLQLGVGNTPNLYRNNTNVSYPYEIPGLISIHRSTATSNPVGFYYFFYDWEVQGPPCPSERDPATAIIYNEVTASTNVVDNPCFGGSSGSINTTTLTGTAPFTYSWSNGSTSASLANLNAGAYTLTITDSNGCDETIIENVTEESEIILTTSKRNVACNGIADGNATVNIGGGVSPYTISWNTSPVQSTNMIDNLNAGFYTATITDANNCSASTEVEIREPDPLVAFYIPTNPTVGNNNGSVNQLVTGGINPYTYSWSNGATTEDLSNLGPGTYFSTVVDRNGCAVLNIVVLTANLIGNPPNSVTKSNYSEVLNVYPNPATNLIDVNFNLIEAGEYLLEIIDVNGKLLLATSNFIHHEGLVTVKMDVSNLNDGLYLVHLISNNGHQTKKLLID